MRIRKLKVSGVAVRVRTPQHCYVALPDICFRILPRLDIDVLASKLTSVPEARKTPCTGK
jgi:hypothetical protein